MPRVFLLDYPPQPLLLSVEEPVGKGGANRRLDVMLVQFFLNVTAQNNESSWGWSIDRKVTKPNIDGVCGPITQDWINRFQDREMKQGKGVADGRVDPIGLDGIRATRSRPLTIYMLNVAYYYTFGANAILRVANHPLMPRELARTFTIPAQGHW
jgi:hypothetical protein